MELCRLNNPVVTMCGGTLNRNNQSICGQNTLEMLSNINIDIAFIGVSGCSADVGFTCGTEGDMLVKRMVIQKARTSVVMCTHDKLKCLMPYTFANVDEIDVVVSDGNMPEETRRYLAEKGIEIL